MGFSKREVVDYEFSVIDDSRASLVLLVPIKNKFMQQAFLKAKSMALKRTGVSDSHGLSDVDEFEVNPKVKPMLLLGTKSARSLTYSEVVSDGNPGFRVVHEVLLRAVYVKLSDSWVCRLFFDISYID